MDYFESGVFGKNTAAWHQKGLVVPGTFDFAEVFPEDGSLGLGGINWEVEKRGIFYRNNEGILVPFEGRFAVCRKTDGSPLGDVGDQYAPIQNREAFAFLRDSMSDHNLRWDTAISVKGGSTIAGIVSLPDSGIELVKGDKHFLYLTVINTHDGSGAMKVFPTDVRVVCANTVAAALNSRDRSLTVNVRHSGSTSTKLSESKRILQSATAEYQRFLEWQGKLTEVHASAKQVEEVALQLFGTPAKDATNRGKTIHENKVLALKAAVRDEIRLLPQFTASGGGASAYNVFNGITRVVDHTFAEAGGASRDRFAYAMLPEGSGSKLKNSGIEVVASVFGVPLKVA